VKEIGEKDDAEKDKTRIGINAITSGDDLGCTNYMDLITRLEFTSMPFLRNYKIKPFLYNEFLYYPHRD
jgi:hypothetical protein